MKNQMLRLIAILLLSAVTARADSAASPVRWEYKIWVDHHNRHEESSDSPRIEIENELNTLGAQGWELVSVVWKKYREGSAPEGRVVYYFKRPLPSKPVEGDGKPPAKPAAEKDGNEHSATRPETKPQNDKKSGAEPEQHPR